MSAISNYIAYYSQNPEILYEYNWQQTFGSMFREIFLHFPFEFKNFLELKITDNLAKNLPLFRFIDFSLWDMFLWMINFLTFLIIIILILWIIKIIIIKIFKIIKNL